jgi:hypothetical protein
VSQPRKLLRGQRGTIRVHSLARSYIKEDKLVMLLLDEEAIQREAERKARTREAA